MAKERSPFTCQAVATNSRAGRAGDPRKTALREAAYIRRTRFTKSGAVLHDFSSRAEDLLMLVPIVPASAPDWVYRPFLRWQLADEAVEEAAVDTVRAWHVCGDLKSGLSPGRWMDDVTSLVRAALPTEAVAEIAAHVPTNKPPHAHILVAPRGFGPTSYGPVDYGLYDRLDHVLRTAWMAWLTG